MPAHVVPNCSSMAPSHCRLLAHAAIPGAKLPPAVAGSTPKHREPPQAPATHGEVQGGSDAGLAPGQGYHLGCGCVSVQAVVLPAGVQEAVRLVLV